MKYILPITMYCILLAACTHTPKPEPVSAVTNPVINTEETIQDNEVKLTDVQYKNANISTTFLQEKSMATVIKVNGKIDVPPQNLVSVSVPMGGYIQQTHLLPGMHVAKGEVIATLEDQQYIQIQQDYLLAKSKLHYAMLEYTRQKELNQSQASSDKVVQQAEQEVRNTRILLSGLSEKLKLININPAKLNESNLSKSTFLHSPISGYVSKVNVNIGKYVNPSDVLFEMVNPTDIHLNLKIFEKNMNQLAIGKKVYAYTNNTPDKKYSCEIILISKDVAPDGTSEVHCHFHTYDKTLLPGMYMNADIETNTKSNNVLPEECIVYYEGKNYVFIKTAINTFTLYEVELSTKENGYVSIANNSELLNKEIVQQGSYTLLMKLKNTEE